MLEFKVVRAFSITQSHGEPCVDQQENHIRAVSWHERTQHVSRAQPSALVSLPTNQVLYTFSTTSRLRKQLILLTGPLLINFEDHETQMKVTLEGFSQPPSLPFSWLVVLNEFGMQTYTDHKQIATSSQITSNLSPILARMLLYT